MSDVIPPPPPESTTGQGVPAPPPAVETPRKRSPLLIVGIVVALLAAAGVAAFFALHSDEGDGTYTANGVTFQYPSAWIHGPSVFLAESGPNVWSETFAPSNGPASVIVSQYTLKVDISTVSAAAAEQEVTALVSGLAKDAGGEITSPVKPTTVGALDGYAVSFTAEVKGTPYDVDMTILFHGTAQYNINCQSSDETRTEIDAGCQQVLSTFALTGESPAP